MPGQQGSYDLKEIVKWRRARDARRIPDKETDELLSAAVDSPALERYREARAGLAELELAKQEGNLLPREEVRTGLAKVSALLREGGAILQRQFGAEAHAVFEDILTDAEREIEKLFSGDIRTSENAR